jgi:hypothetical protein
MNEEDPFNLSRSSILINGAGGNGGRKSKFQNKNNEEFK